MDIGGIKINENKIRRLIYAFEGDDIYILLLSKEYQSQPMSSLSYEWIIINKKTKYRKIYECSQLWENSDNTGRTNMSFGNEKYRLSYPFTEDAKDKRVILTKVKENKSTEIELRDVGELFKVLDSI